MKTKGISGVLIIVIVAVLAVFGVVVFNQLTKRGDKAGVGQERKFVALGASMTKANNLSSSLAGDNPEYSFATGTKIDSVFLYLKNKGENLTAVNLAESGANSGSVLQKQVPNVISYNPKYIVVDIMADIFEEEMPVKFEKNLTEIIKQVKNDENTVLIGTYPNLVLMRSATHKSCSEDKLHLGIGRITETKLRLFNQVIGDIAKKYSLVLVDNFNTLGPQEVSDYDCLHPNIEGQKKLAEAWIEAFKKRR